MHNLSIQQQITDTYRQTPWTSRLTTSQYALWIWNMPDKLSSIKCTYDREPKMSDRAQTFFVITARKLSLKCADFHEYELGLGQCKARSIFTEFLYFFMFLFISVPQHIMLPFNIGLSRWGALAPRSKFQNFRILTSISMFLIKMVLRYMTGHELWAQFIDINDTHT